MISKCQALAQEFAQAKRDLISQETEASNAIMNWEAENPELKNNIIRLEDDLMDHWLDLASRAASPERAQGQAPRASQLGPTEVMEMINSALTS
eukprot:9673448-Heterocapsa_arctica.AAC.1